VEIREDDIGYFDDYSKMPDLEVFESAVLGYPNAVKEALSRKLITRQELIDNGIIEQ
jgi:hypothetical protein